MPIPSDEFYSADYIDELTGVVLPGTYAQLDGTNRLAVNSTEITASQVGADPAGAAAGLALVFGA